MSAFVPGVRPGFPAPAGVKVHEPELDPPFAVLEPAALTSPLVLSSPHSGAIYPASFLASSRLDKAVLRRSEDAYVDELFLGGLKSGAPLLRAHFPRAYLDLNREPYELDPRMFETRLPAFANPRSVRVAGGLGTVARIIGDSQEIYAHRLKLDEVLARIEALYHPYHRRLEALLTRAWQNFGTAVLIDCHSMPSLSNCPPGRESERRVKADFVLGDRYGTSCGAELVDCAEQALRALGYSVLRNKPYAGGFITEHYGDPGNNLHALQIEINRGLYMDEASLAKTARFAAIADDLSQVLAALAAHVGAGLSTRRFAAE
jgi:N-formylglutamate amidohydrolase